MAGKIRHLHEREGRYWARVVIPQRLRHRFENKWQLQVPLGGDRREAEKKLHGAVARMLDQIAAAERQQSADVVSLTDRQGRPRPLSVVGMAKAHHASELELDALERLHPDRDAVTDMSTFRPVYVASLKRVVAGRASNEEMAAAIGWAIDSFRQRGNTEVTYGSPEWRQLAMSLAGVQLDAFERMAERDELGVERESDHPLLKSAPVEALRPPVELDKLFNDYVKEAGVAPATINRWRPVIATLKAFLKHDDAGQIDADDLIAWKDKLLQTLAPKTVKNVHLAAVKAVLSFGVDNRRLTDNRPRVSRSV